MNRALIIAEAGVNHNGSIEIAKKLVDTAKECGADIVKFQTAKLDSLASKHAQMAEYQKKNTGTEESQKDMLKKLLLDYESFIEIAEYCKEKKIEFLSTPFDIESIYFLAPMVKFWKVPSGEVTNYPYLIEIAKTGKPVVLSTGMSTIDEVEAAYELLRKNGSGEITLLHCTTEYPAPIEDVNLRAMNTLKEKFECNVGYSDHTSGIDIPIVAVAMGATIIEKHFTLDRNMEGPDHKASLEPNDLSKMVKAIRRIEIAMGDGKKEPSEAEKGNKAVARKSIVAKKDIRKGEIFSNENITTKRPGSGINPMRWEEILGTTAKRDFMEDELIEL